MYVVLFLILSLFGAFAESEKDYSVLPPFNGKPRIFVIGDSTSFGYTPFLEERLTKFQVVHAPGNSGNSAHGASNISTWAGYSDSWELCILNHGLHDVVENKKIPYPNYQKHIAYEFEVLSKNCKRRMFLTSTMIPPKTIGSKNADVVIYNAHIKAFLNKRGGVKVCDLYQKSVEIPELYKNAKEQNNLHLTVKGDERLADYIINCIENNFPDMFK